MPAVILHSLTAGRVRCRSAENASESPGFYPIGLTEIAEFGVAAILDVNYGETSFEGWVVRNDSTMMDVLS